ncbi:Pancreatic triacylglycerol lipase, partial [Pseudolycoriella hygida]
MKLRKKRDTSMDEFNNQYNPSKETKILIHGWRSSTNSDTVQHIKDAYLQKFDYNVIAVDWESVASNFFYFTPATQTRDVGRYVAELIYYLCTDQGTDLNKIHIIGHSLGAHAAGFAGSFVGPGKVSRITGLDPAMPKFDFVAPDGRLDTSDAQFVDVIHSCAGTLGIKKSIGHVDFYPNNGEAIQPGCTGVKEFTEACSHGRSHKFFAESITSPIGFYGHYCDSYDSYIKGKCPANSMIMGDPTPSSARGVYYLRTNAEPPFALGNV